MFAQLSLAVLLTCFVTAQAGQQNQGPPEPKPEAEPETQMGLDVPENEGEDGKAPHDGADRPLHTTESLGDSDGELPPEDKPLEVEAPEVQTDSDDQGSPSIVLGDEEAKMDKVELVQVDTEEDEPVLEDNIEYIDILDEDPDTADQGNTDIPDEDRPTEGGPMVAKSEEENGLTAEEDLESLPLETTEGASAEKFEDLPEPATGDTLATPDDVDRQVKTDEQHTTKQRPNIVIIVADDLGMGDVGCFGNDTIRTPNIDRIAREGAKLTHNIAAASVCTPSRAALLTGRYPIRMGMTPTNIVRVNMFVAATGGLPASEITFAELAKKQGYATALIGKWHLGVHCWEKDFCHHPLKQGFDYFYGLPLTNLKDFGGDGQNVTESRLPHINAILVVSCILGILTALLLRRILGILLTILLILLSITIPALVFVTYRNLTLLDSVLMRNYDVIEQPIQLNNRLAARMANEGAKFIDRQAEDDTPFLLFMSWVQVHTALHTSPEFTGVSKHGKYGDTVEEMDWTVGEILDALDRAGIKDETFVYFSSDNGGHNEETGIDGDRQGGWNGIYRGGKMQGGMDGGIRVPTAVMYPGVIPAGRIIDHPTSLMDILPTVAKLMDVDVPDDRVMDGTDIGRLLVADTGTPPHEFLFHYCGKDIHAARYTPADDSGDVWKVHYVTPRWLPGTNKCLYVCDCYGNAVERHDPPLLYNIGKDPSEDIELDPTDSKHKPIVEKMRAAVKSHTSSLEDVPNQFSIPHLLPMPWLQPCCGGPFPKCDCEEPKT